MTKEQEKYISYLRRSCSNGQYKSIEEANKQKILRGYGRSLKLTDLQLDQAVSEATLN